MLTSHFSQEVVCKVVGVLDDINIKYFTAYATTYILQKTILMEKCNFKNTAIYKILIFAPEDIPL